LRKSHELVDPTNPLQVGIVVGVFGGNILEAVLVFFVLGLFQKTNGRTANTMEVGLILGLMVSLSRFYP
jgi:hypothetical protein